MNVRKARERLGLTMAELAEFAGVSITSISNIENKKKVSDKTLAKVVNTLMELEHYEVWGEKRRNSMRLIDADKIVEQINEWLDQTGAIPLNTSYHFELLGCIEDCPTIDAVPVVRGEWKLYGNDDDSGMSYWCTVCNFQLSEDLFYSGYKNGRWIENGVFKYCPNCGAKMEVEP